MTLAAEGLGASRQAVSELINERTGISVEMAIRLSKAFGSTPETWLGMQMACDLWQARDRAGQIVVERLAAAWSARFMSRVFTRQDRGRVVESCRCMAGGGIVELPRCSGGMFRSPWSG